MNDEFEIPAAVAPLSANSDWPEPEPLSTLRLVSPLQPEMLPAPLRPWLVDIAERMQVPIEYPAIGALTALSSLIGRRCTIRPKQFDDWQVVPNLWGLIVGAPGLKKSPALEEALKPLRQLEKEAYEQHAAQCKATFDTEVGKCELKELQEKIRAAVRNGEDPAQFQKDYERLSTPPPRMRRYRVSDTTTERLAMLLAENRRGLLLYRDELMGWLRSFERQGREGDRTFYLEAWSGDGTFVVDRVSREITLVEGLCMAVLGSIQPGPLAGYLREALRAGTGADGLLQRFQLLVWPDFDRQWRPVDRKPDMGARRRAHELFRRIDLMAAAEVGAISEGEELPFLRYSTSAQPIADAHVAELAQKVRAAGEHPAICSHLAKYESLLPSLALILHLTDLVDTGTGGDVSAEATTRAVSLCRFLEGHARRLYTCTDGGDGPGLLLAGRLADLPPVFTARDVYKDRGWSGLTTRELVEAEAAALVKLGWLRLEKIREVASRPMFRYQQNPNNPGSKR